MCMWASATVQFTNRFTVQDASLLRCDCVGQVTVDVSKGQAVLEFCAEVPFLCPWNNPPCVLLVAYCSVLRVCVC
jgi:hypothetical protein